MVLCGCQTTSCCSLVAESRHAVAEGWRQVQLVREEVMNDAPAALAEGEIMTQLARTSTPGIYRAHGVDARAETDAPAHT